MAALRKKAGYCNPPAAFRGAGLVMIIAGFMAMAFMGFAGMVAIE
jgi:Na+-translocating ferredoxin:NAD+ oxidoreductase RnfA subunit